MKILLHSIAFLLVCTFIGCGREPERNIVLITADTLRADHLGCYGYKRNTSPNIDSLASTGSQFTDASSAIDNTVPSHISILTSMYPKRHGVYTNWNRQDVQPVTLAQILKNHGYTNAAFVSSFILHSDKVRINKGFDYYRNTDRLKVPADETINDALDWIRANDKKKFFVWIHLFDPHMPYNPPSPYDKAFDPDYRGWGRIYFDVLNRKESAVEAASTPGLTKAQTKTLRLMDRGPIDVLDITYNKIGLNERDSEYVKSLYDGEILFMDHAFGVLLGEIRKLDLSKKTLVVFTADHGESLGEHGIYWDHKGIYEPEIKIPLIITVPGMRSSKIDGMASNIDILPTLLDLLRLSVRREVLQGFDGKSLAPLMWGKTEKVRDEIFIEQSNNMGKAIKKNDYKYIFPIKESFSLFPNDFKHREGLYHLKTDPGELSNLMAAGNLKDTPYQPLKDVLVLWAGETLSPRKESADFEKLDKEHQEKLRALGYLN